jgi:hypothetical protein
MTLKSSFVDLPSFDQKAMTAKRGLQLDSGRCRLPNGIQYRMANTQKLI